MEDGSAHKSRKKHDERDLEKEIHQLKTKLKVAKCHLQQAKSQRELQSIRTKQLVVAWQSRVEDAEDKCRKYKEQRDRELKDISSQLLFFHGQLMKEQSKIQTNMQDKEQIISDQIKTISQLSNENKKLSDILLITKQLKMGSFQSGSDEFQKSLDNLTRYDSGLGFQSKSDSVTEDYIGEFMEFQKAFDTIKSRHNSIASFSCHDDKMSDFISDVNITQDDVFKDSIDNEMLASSYPDVVKNTDIKDKINNSESVSHKITQDVTVEYANPKAIRRKKKKKPHSTKQLQSNKEPVYKVKSRHMSIDLDRSFDSVKFANGGSDGIEETHWYSDDPNEELKTNSNPSKTCTGDDISVHSFDRRQGGSFFRDIFNTLRHKTIRIKRKRSKSLSSSSKMPVIFLSQSVPDIPYAEVSIDEAIAKRRQNKVVK